MSRRSPKISKSKTPEVSQLLFSHLALVLDEEADLTAIYITAIVVGVIILAISIVVLTSYRQEKQTNTNAMKDRNREPAQWGIRMLESNNVRIVIRFLAATSTQQGVAKWKKIILKSVAKKLF